MTELFLMFLDIIVMAQLVGPAYNAFSQASTLIIFWEYSVITTLYQITIMQKHFVGPLGLQMTKNVMLCVAR